MACAVPVVATDIGDTRWVTGETGHLVPPGDPAALAKACIEILDSGITQDLAARTRIEQQFSIESVLQKFAALLSSPHESAAAPVAPVPHPLATPLLHP